MTSSTGAVLLGAYLLGSIPSAYVVARLVAGVDIRRVGDGNMGAKNTYLTIGRLPGFTVAAADIGKGALAVALARYLRMPDGVVYWAGALAVLGHDFPIFLGFRGGQGMAAMVGVFGVLFPREMLISLCAIAVAFLLTRNWDLSCAIGFVLLPTLMWLGGQPVRRILYPILLLPTIGLSKVLQIWRTRDPAASSQ